MPGDLYVFFSMAISISQAQVLPGLAISSVTSLMLSKERDETGVRV